MNTEPENFDSLQKLLALKRHEQPPPRYFNDFSEKIIARLRTDHRPGWAAWFQRLGFGYDPKPAIVCALGVIVCGLLLAGIITATQLSPSALASGKSGRDGNVSAYPGATAMAAGTTSRPILRPEEIPGSTTPVMTTSSPFNQFNVHAQKAGFTIGVGGN